MAVLMAVYHMTPDAIGALSLNQYASLLNEAPELIRDLGAAGWH